jgi:hypothetical protein
MKKNKHNIPKKPHSSLSMVSFDRNDTFCLRSFSNKDMSKKDSISCKMGDSSSINMTSRKKPHLFPCPRPLRIQGGQEGRRDKPIRLPSRPYDESSNREISYSIYMSKKMSEDENLMRNKASYWPSSVSVSGTGRMRNVTVIKKDSEDLTDFVEEHGGTWQEE